MARQNTERKETLMTRLEEEEAKAICQYLVGLNEEEKKKVRVYDIGRTTLIYEDSNKDARFLMTGVLQESGVPPYSTTYFLEARCGTDIFFFEDFCVNTFSRTEDHTRKPLLQAAYDTLMNAYLDNKKRTENEDSRQRAKSLLDRLKE